MTVKCVSGSGVPLAGGTIIYFVAAGNCWEASEGFFIPGCNDCAEGVGIWGSLASALPESQVQRSSWCPHVCQQNATHLPE